MSLKEKLLSPLTKSELLLRNRIVMAPMNRRRAKDGIPGDSAVTYYGQRSGAGLILTDNTAVTPNGKGYLHTPGIYNEAQILGWRKVTGEVHKRGGKIFMQLVHAGRIGHTLNNEDGSPLVAPSAVPSTDRIRVPGNLHLPIPAPQALSITQIKMLIGKHVDAAIKAIEAGFDGVEVHGAHGFLTEQFLHPHTNTRTDEYGGSILNRSRFLLEIMEGIIKAIGKERTGIRLSPFITTNDMPQYSEEIATHQYIVDELNKLDILYIHLSGSPHIPVQYIRDVRSRFKNILILAGGFTAESAEAALQENLADLIAFGRPFIANPDLVERFRNNHPLAASNEALHYEGGDNGYVDYPVFGN